MSKTLLFLSISLSMIMGLGACNNKLQTKVGAAGDGGNNGGGSGGQGKPGLAPSFDVAQFKKGQWIQWKGTSGNLSQCLRWTWTEVKQDGIEIQSRVLKNCKDEPSHRVEHIFFDHTTGFILEHYFVTGNTASDGPMKGKSIFSFIYGNPDKKETVFNARSADLLGTKYPVYEFDSKKGSLYLNLPANPFHAVLLRFAAKDLAGINWNYQLHESLPAIPALPKE